MPPLPANDPHAAEAKERWGHTDAYAQSQARVQKMTQADLDGIREEGEAINRAITERMKAGDRPESPAVQAQIAKHWKQIGRFYDCTACIYRGLAEMYVQDPRFAAVYAKHDPALPAFFAQAMNAYADAHPDA